MNKERLNTNFDINEKYENIIQNSKEIIDRYNQTHDDSCEAPSYICLAYDVKNYLPKLQQENKQLQQKIDKATMISLQLRTHLSNWLFKEGYMGGERTKNFLDELDEILKGEPNNE